MLFLYHYKSITIHLLLLLDSFVSSRNFFTFRKEGESCTLPNNDTGICRVASACKKLSARIVKQDVLIFQPCGFVGRLKLHCCLPTAERAIEACKKYNIRAKPSRSALVSNGEPAYQGDYPHLVALWYDDSSKTPWQCGGAIISPRFVLTAAHCISRIPPSKLVVGASNLNQVESELPGAGDMYDIEEIIVHPLFNPKVTMYNDIALLKTSKTMKEGPYVFPACLQTDSTIPTSSFFIAGFGPTKDIGGTSNVLMTATINELSEENCSIGLDSLDEFKRKRFFPRGILSSMICAQSAPTPNGFSDVCQGDSGTPLQYRSEVFYIAGLTSSGGRCGDNTPGLYTRVSDFVPWIQTFVWRD